MPMTLRREETCVEFDVYSDHAAVEEFAAQGVDASFERWGDDFQEAVAGMCVAAALAKLMAGELARPAARLVLGLEERSQVSPRDFDRLMDREQPVPRLIEDDATPQRELLTIGPKKLSFCRQY
jgi:hypothetical protein